MLTDSGKDADKWKVFVKIPIAEKGLEESPISVSMSSAIAFFALRLPIQYKNIHQPPPG